MPLASPEHVQMQGKWVLFVTGGVQRTIFRPVKKFSCWMKAKADNYVICMISIGYFPELGAVERGFL